MIKHYLFWANAVRWTLIMLIALGVMVNIGLTLYG